MRGSIVRRTRHWIANRGFAGTLAESFRRVPIVFRRLQSRFCEEAQLMPPRPAAHPFDVRHGVDTSGLIWGEDLKSPHPDTYWASGYYAISPAVFWKAMDRLNLPWERFTFIDVGCGKGRALLLAQRYRFRHLVGLEISPELANIAQENQKKFHASWNLASQVEILQCDAAEFVWPAEPSVLFLYHPFARPVMMRLLKNLSKSLRAHPPEIYLVYANPELHDAILKAGFLVKLWDDYFDVAEEDLTADFFGEHREHITAYRNV